ncbi:MAG: hypothetical protein PHQ81_02925 [Methanofollis sp.]|nr:hypothetical protein [Methanofollis sp.]
MDRADDNSKPGTPIKVQAKDISDDSDVGQYSCILCGEPVRHYNGEIQKAHFRHIEGSSIARNCELYAKNHSGYSDDELKRKISGLPFYLRQIGDSFKLYIGFWPVDGSTLAEEKRIGQKIVIKNEKRIQIDVIDSAKIRADETYRLPISWVYESYELSYERSGTPLSEIWGEKSSRIFKNGTFFRIGDIYSRSISLNGIITPDTSYYLLSQYPVTDKSFLKVEESYPLLTEGTQKWKVYKIRFTKITRESAQYARDHHVQLREKPPEIIPLWPPSIQNNQKYIHQKTGSGTYYLKSSQGDGKWEVAILDKYKRASERQEVSLKNPIFTIEVDNKIKYLSLFDNENDLEVILVAKDDKTAIPYQQPVLELKWMNKRIVPGSELKAIKNADLSIKSNMKCDIIRMRNQIQNLIFRNELSLPSFPDLVDGDTIILRHGLDSFPPLYFRKTKSTAENTFGNNLSDEALYLKLIHQRGITIPVSAQLKYIVAGFENYPKTSEYLKKSLKTGKIPNQAAKCLFKMYYQGGI